MKLKKWIAWLLVLCLLLGGCVKGTPQDTTAPTTSVTQTTTQSADVEEPVTPPEQLLRYKGANPLTAPKFENMKYTRPDLEAIDQAVDYCMSLIESTDSKAVLAAFEHFMVLFSDFTTNYWLSYIHYNLDLSDEYWEQEQDFCNGYVARLDADQDILMHALAASSHRDYLEQHTTEGIFDGYEGESLWTDRFTELMEQEKELQMEYFALSEEGANVETLGQLLIDMIGLRKQIAEEAGYEDYPSFAYDLYYQRDYTVEDAAAYLETIRQELVPLYQTAVEDDGWMDGIRAANSESTLSYVEQVSEAMGVMVEQAFSLMTQKELYDMSHGYNKMSGAFTSFLPDHMTPFVYMDPTGTTYDYMTLTHEFGHFSRGLAVGGAAAGIDVEEIFSQGLENLSLCYGGAELTQLRMFLILSVYVEQGAFADFEHRIYDLEPEELTVEALRRTFEQVAEDYGLDYPSGAFAQIDHFFLSPLYVISYVTSGDAALQLYQMELAEPGSGVACYNEALVSWTTTFLAFLEETGLESPFAPGRIQDVREMLENAL